MVPRPAALVPTFPGPGENHVVPTRKRPEQDSQPVGRWPRQQAAAQVITCASAAPTGSIGQGGIFYRHSSENGDEAAETSAPGVARGAPAGHGPVGPHTPGRQTPAAGGAVRGPGDPDGRGELAQVPGRRDRAHGAGGAGAFEGVRSGPGVPPDLSAMCHRARQPAQGCCSTHGHENPADPRACGQRAAAVATTLQSHLDCVANMPGAKGNWGTGHRPSSGQPQDRQSAALRLPGAGLRRPGNSPFGITTQREQTP